MSFSTTELHIILNWRPFEFFSIIEKKNKLRQPFSGVEKNYFFKRRASYNFKA